MLKFDDQGELLEPVKTLGVWFAEPILLDSSYEQNRWIESNFEKYLNILEPYKEVVGKSLVYLARNDNNESSLGNFVTDSMLAAWDNAEV